VICRFFGDLPGRKGLKILFLCTFCFREVKSDRCLQYSIAYFQKLKLSSKSYKNLPPKKALERQEKEKKKKYCKPCENQRRHFTPFIVSTDGMFGFEARAFPKRLAKLLAEEWKKPYSVLMKLE